MDLSEAAFEEALRILAYPPASDCTIIHTDEMQDVANHLAALTGCALIEIPWCMMETRFTWGVIVGGRSFVSAALG